MQHSESIKAIAAALLAAQSEMENAHKNANNPAFRSKYADLAEILATIKPVLTKNGVVFLQSPGFADGLVTLDTLLMHPASGEWISGSWASPVSKSDPQGVGSATTYGRRYSLAALCGIAQEDDDGNAASTPARSYDAPPKITNNNPPARPAPRPSEPVGVKHSNVPDIENQTLTFGKHSGKTWGWLVEHDPNYVQYCIEKVDRVAPEAKQMLTLMLAERSLRTPAPDTGSLAEPEPDLLPF